MKHRLKDVDHEQALLGIWANPQPVPNACISSYNAPCEGTSSYTQSMLCASEGLFICAKHWVTSRFTEQGYIPIKRKATELKISGEVYGL